MNPTTEPSRTESPLGTESACVELTPRDVQMRALLAFVIAARDWNDRNEERRCEILVDEARIICSSKLATFVMQCSSANRPIIFSNQALDTLESSSPLAPP